ncbi:hypothetical protein EVAR_64749_1 [Eumeta japonica]|uniref:Uncharacterized protein n=1 Tax=Eumeta variegata TaxID=151549 RepID=A0A4C1Z9Q1_EUMVA|nr:hypothetical protein EVAR_64749_1 [Eumeta japonica]
MQVSSLVTFVQIVCAYREAEEKYYASLATEAGTKNLPSVITKIREESSIRFLHNLQHYRKDVYKVIDDDTYEIISGEQEALC